MQKKKKKKRDRMSMIFDMFHLSIGAVSESVSLGLCVRPER